MSRISAGSVIRRTAELFLNRAVDVLFLFTLLGMSVSLVTRLVPAGFEAAVAVLGGVLWVMFAASMLHIFGGDRRERSIGDMYESSYRGLGWTTVQLLLGLAMTAVTGLAVAGLPVLFRRSG
ncbi:MAG: hypothetical protein SVU32_08860, partial [Candidatus Nanohaloarchaea archaeon]|nr:hypothetical protein [Candidatus Nanohaloarchaea archaeon]